MVAPLHTVLALRIAARRLLLDEGKTGVSVPCCSINREEFTPNFETVQGLNSHLHDYPLNQIYHHAYDACVAWKALQETGQLQEVRASDILLHSLQIQTNSFALTKVGNEYNYDLISDARRSTYVAHFISFRGEDRNRCLSTGFLSQPLLCTKHDYYL